MAFQEHNAEGDGPVHVTCGDLTGILNPRTLLISVSHGEHAGCTYNPAEFEHAAGRGRCKKWKTTIKVHHSDALRAPMTLAEWAATKDVHLPAISISKPLEARRSEQRQQDVPRAPQQPTTQHTYIPAQEPTQQAPPPIHHPQQLAASSLPPNARPTSAPIQNPQFFPHSNPYPPPPQQHQQPPATNTLPKPTLLPAKRKLHHQHSPSEATSTTSSIHHATAQLEGGQQVALQQLQSWVLLLGGCQEVTRCKGWACVASRLGLPLNSALELQQLYITDLLHQEASARVPLPAAAAPVLGAARSAQQHQDEQQQLHMASNSSHQHHPYHPHQQYHHHHPQPQPYYARQHDHHSYQHTQPTIPQPITHPSRPMQQAPASYSHPQPSHSPSSMESQQGYQQPAPAAAAPRLPQQWGPYQQEPQQAVGWQQYGPGAAAEQQQEEQARHGPALQRSFLQTLPESGSAVAPAAQQWG